MNFHFRPMIAAPLALTPAFQSAAAQDDYSLDALVDRKNNFKKNLKHHYANGSIDQFDMAERVAWFNHGDILRRNGTLYIEHVAAVAQKDNVIISYSDPDLILVAWGHDVPEETTIRKNLKREPKFRKAPWELDDFRDLGFSEKVVDGIGILQKPEDVLYGDHIEHVSETWVSPVKIRDNCHNHADAGVTPDRSRLYTITMPYLFQTLHNPQQTPAGSSLVEFAKRAGLYDEELLSRHSTRIFPVEASLNLMQPR